jgi:hypothetical protein
MLSTTHRSLACLLIAGGVLTYTPVQGLPPDIHVRNYARFNIRYTSPVRGIAEVEIAVRYACDQEAITYEKKHKYRHPGNYAFNQSLEPSSPIMASYTKIGKDNYILHWQCNGYWFVYGTDSD